MDDAFVGLTTGTRVAVRCRIDPPPAHGPRLSDTVGDVTAVDEDSLRVRTRTGEVTVRRDLVTALRVIPPRPTRRGAPHRAIGIEDLHLVMTQGQPALESHWLGEIGSGWLLRAGGGWTGRSNSALPLGSPGLPLAAAVDALESWYAARGLTPTVMLPRPRGASTGADPLGALLLERGYVESAPTEVLTGRTADLAAAAAPAPVGVVVSSADRVDEPWLTASSDRVTDHLASAREILALPPRQVFLTAADDEGSIAGVVRVALNDGWAGVFGLHVAPPHRRRGLGRHLSASAARAAGQAGASLVYLQVERDNTAAHDLYTGLGLRPHHEYSYLADPRPRWAHPTGLTHEGRPPTPPTRAP